MRTSVYSTGRSQGPFEAHASSDAIFSGDDAQDVSGLSHVEDDYRQIVIHA